MLHGSIVLGADIEACFFCSSCNLSRFFPNLFLSRYQQHHNQQKQQQENKNTLRTRKNFKIDKMYSDNGSSESIFEKYHHYSMRYQAFLDRLNGKPLIRWCFFLFLTSIYLFRVFYWSGWYIVTYALGIYYLNLLIAFLSPQVDPELLDDVESIEANEKMVLPNVSVNRNFKMRQSEDADSEFRPFVRRLPEFKFW